MDCATKKYYMSADGGGSKLSVILFDQDLKILGRGFSGAINPKFVSDRMIRSNFEIAITNCLKYTNITHIDTLYIAMPGPIDLFAYMLSKRVRLNRYRGLTEGENSLFGGIFAKRGVVALSGTGTGIFNVNGTQSTHMGGWGGLFDDEGSGYSIGRAALNAAVKAYEKRGPFTILPELIVDKWQLIRFNDVVNHVYSSDDYRGLIASLTNAVVDAAAEDVICCEILYQAGLEMAQQVIAIFGRDQIPDDVPIMVAGSVWKDNPFMFRAFHQAVTKAIPGCVIYFPWYEAVIGGVIAFLYEQKEVIEEELIQKIKTYYPDFRYNVGRSEQFLNEKAFQNVRIGPDC